MSGTVINVIYLIFYLLFQTTLWLVNSFYILQWNKSQRSKNSCLQFSGDGGTQLGFRLLAVWMQNSSLFPESLHYLLRMSSTPNICKWKVKYLWNLFMCNRAKLNCSAIYFLNLSLVIRAYFREKNINFQFLISAEY